jgi:hypothetical protein
MTDFNAPARLRELEHIRKYPHHCHAEVTRKGELEPCGRTPVAIRNLDNEGYTGWWPVCAYHTRKGQMASLAELLETMAALGG